MFAGPIFPPSSANSILDRTHDCIIISLLLFQHWLAFLPNKCLGHMRHCVWFSKKEKCISKKTETSQAYFCLHSQNTDLFLWIKHVTPCQFILDITVSSSVNLTICTNVQSMCMSAMLLQDRQRERKVKAQKANTTTKHKIWDVHGWHPLYGQITETTVGKRAQSVLVVHLSEQKYVWAWVTFFPAYKDKASAGSLRSCEHTCLVMCQSQASE